MRLLNINSPISRVYQNIIQSDQETISIITVNIMIHRHLNFEEFFSKHI